MTSKKRSDALVQAAIRAARVGLWEWNLRTSKVTFSAEWKQLLGYEESEIRDEFGEWERRLHPDDLPRIKQLLADYLDHPWPDYRAEFRMRHKDGSWRWILTQADLLRDKRGKPTHMIGSHIDITEEKHAAAELARINRALRMLSDSNQALIRTRDERELVEEVCRIAVGVGGYQLAWIGFAEHDERKTIRPVAQAGEDDGYLAAADISWADGPGGSGPAARAIRTGKTCIVRDIAHATDFGTRQQAARNRGYQSAIAFPLTGDRGLLGVLKIYSSDLDAFDVEEVGILAELAGDVAFGISALRTQAEHKAAEAALRRTEVDLQLALEAARLGSWNWNIVTGEITWSARCKALYGLPDDAPITYERFLQAVHPDDRASADAALQRAVELRSDYEIEKRVVWPDGSLHWNISRGRVLCDADGQPIRMTGVTLDISERKRADESVRIAERRLGTLMDSFPDLVSRFDTQGRFTYISPSIGRAMGIPPETILGRTPLELGVSGDAGTNRMLQDSIARILAGGPAERLDAEFQTPTGSRPFEIRHIPEKDDRGAVVSVLGIATDLTQRKAAERQLYLLNFALDHIGEGIYLMPGNSPRFIYVNQSAAEALGYSREELTGGMGIFDIDPEWSPERWEQFWPELLERRRATLQSVHRSRNGRIVPVEITGNVFEYEGQIYDMAVVRDISERKTAETALRDSETMYRSLVMAMAEGAVFQAADGTITAVNPAAERIRGRSAAEMLGTTSEAPDWGAIREDGTPFPDNEHPSMVTLRTGEPRSGVVMGIRRPDGSRAWISINSQPLARVGEPLPYAVVTTFHDITDRRAAEAAVEVREREFRTLAENTPDFIVRWDAELRRVYVNPAFARTLDAAAERIVGTPLGSHYSPADEAALRDSLRALAERIRAVFATAEASEAEVNWVTAEGARVYLLRLVPERATDGTIRTVLGLGRDVTTLKERERQLRTLAEHSPDIIIRFDREGRYLYANSALERLTGARVGEHLGRSLGEFSSAGPYRAPPEVYRALRERITAVYDAGTPFESEVQLPLQDGDHTFEVRLIPESDEDGQVTSVLAIARDITERERAGEALRASEQRFRQVTENIDEVFWLTNADKTEMVYISPAYERVWGRPCASLYASPQSWLEAVHPEDQERTIEAAHTLQAAGTYDIEYRIRRPDGAWRWIHDRAFPIRDADGRVYRIAGVAEDVTLRRELEDQLRQAQKMEAIGQLAGGIAHDFNNMLAVVQMQSTLLLEETANSPETRDGLREILGVTERAANLTRQLLTFSRRQVSKPIDLDISDTIGHMTRLLHRVLGEDISLETRFAPSLPLLHADPGMMEQVLMNLAINARDAMPHGGRLAITLEALAVSEQRAALHPGTIAGRFVCLTVADTGSGIPAEALPRIFEPFFTTKEVGKGTGLGLATVFGIVEQHHGWIEVESRVGEGSTFKVFLPTLLRPTAAGTSSGSVPAARGGTETILLVEDEPAVRSVTRAALERYGYRVLEADSAAAAIGLWNRESATVHLLLTDLIMPGAVSGRQLAETLLAGRPGLRVIYTTGYSPDIVNRMLHFDPGHTLIQKPYTAKELAACVRRVLDQEATGAG
jgi:PAS domain S-box-containing protein